MKGILAKFDKIKKVEKAIDELLKIYPKDKIIFYSPFPVEHIQEKLTHWNSPVRFITLTGGLLGFLTAIALTYIASTIYVIPVGGKPIVSWPPYIIIMFELTVLLGSIFNLIGVILLSGLPDIFLFVGWKPYIKDGKFGVLVLEGSKEAEKIFEECGAEEIKKIE